MADITHLDTRRNTNVTRGQKRADDSIHCLQIPMYQESILLPNAAVAEVITYTQPEPLPNAPEWYLGKIDWRERKVPLLSFEAASGAQNPGTTKGTRIAVLNTLNSNPRMPYIAVVTQGIPSLKLVREKQIVSDDSVVTNRQSVARFVWLDNVSLLVPDIDDLEARIERLHVV